MRQIESLKIPFNGCRSRYICRGAMVLFVNGIEVFDGEGRSFTVVLGYVLHCGDGGGVFASAHEEFGTFVEVEDEEAEYEHYKCKTAHTTY